MIENGMVVGAEAAWEKLNARPDFDDMGDTDVIEYMSEKGYDVQVFAKMLDIHGYFDEDVAVEMIEKLLHVDSWKREFAQNCREYLERKCA